MRSQKSQNKEGQLEPGKILLESFIDMKNELVCLGKVINWDSFQKKFGKSFYESQARPGLPIRLMAGLTYLKHLYNLSDEQAVKQLLEIPYWQHFCGFLYFQKTIPLEASSLARFHAYLGEEVAEELLKQTIEAAKQMGFQKKKNLYGFDLIFQCSSLLKMLFKRLNAFFRGAHFKRGGSNPKALLKGIFNRGE